MALTHYEVNTHIPTPEIPDPTLLEGEALLEHIATFGLTRTVSSDPFGAQFISDVWDRLGSHHKDVALEFTGHPENPDNLVVRFSLLSATVTD